MALSVDLIVADPGGATFYTGVAPQFAAMLGSSGGIAVLQDALDRAEGLHNTSYFRGQATYNEAMALYAAHLLAQQYPQMAIGTGTGTGAAAQSLKAGDLSITYGATAVGGVSPTGDTLDSTPWGQRYKALRRAWRQTPRYISGL
jgi:hypothetical protein